MGCPGKAILAGEPLVFSVCVHDPSTSALTVPDGDPLYRVYEDETGLGLLSGYMIPLDSPNTVGFYVGSIACTTVAGFENGKGYTIYITASVNGTMGGISYNFIAESQLLSSISLTGTTIVVEDG